MPFPIHPIVSPAMPPRRGGAPNPAHLAALRAAILSKLAPRVPVSGAPVVGAPAMPVAPAGALVPNALPPR
jgi:hypothetical protein